MPVTKTAKRALRVSKRKEKINSLLRSKLEAMIRLAQKSKSNKDVALAVSLADKAAKKKYIHKNKASRIKSQLSQIGKKATSK